MLPLDESHDPPRPGPTHFVRRLKAGQNAVILVLSRTWWGINTHWGNNRSSPHLRAKKDCPGCKQGFPLRWKGYLHIINMNNHAQEFLELTPLMIDNMVSQCGDGKNMRGQRFNVSRGKGDKARCAIAVLPNHSAFKNACELPPEADPKPVLLELWGLSAASLGDEPEIALHLPEAI